ncbi:MAG TPA: hypothetical protein VH309_04405 [Elusimicrobiota bacterium]|nr:hypothetical protein [Elusimicrobiota bacterium]
MPKTTGRKRGRAGARPRRRRPRREASRPPRESAFRPQAPITETDSEDEGGAYGNGRGETDPV